MWPAFTAGADLFLWNAKWLPTPTCCCQRRAHINNNRIVNDGRDRIEILLLLTNADTAVS